ncbi:uncharacterized protein VTP21DRAFT_7716 [Calcarisporiella thermophila]|uniref:uncharacterized protein n=1 Tax=Calcarisporiella thermophila TaxID=911321 RepID=UPI0037438146
MNFNTLSQINITRHPISEKCPYVDIGTERYKLWKDIVDSVVRPVEQNKKDVVANVFCVEYIRHESLVDYPEALKKLDEVVWVEAKKIKIVALCGEEGAGKLQVALEFCHRVKDDFKYIFWMEASTETVLLNSFRNAAKSIGLLHPSSDLKTVVLRVRLWMQKNAGWLLIFNDTDDFTLGKSSNTYLQDNYFPKEGQGVILLTTRQGNLGENIISIGLDDLGNQMNDAAALELLLRKKVGVSDNPEALCLVRELEHLPLALDIVGGYMKEYEIPLEEFLTLRREGVEGLCKFNHLFSNELHEITKTSFGKLILFIWRDMLNRLRNECSFSSLITVKTIQFIALLYPERILLSLFKSQARTLFGEACKQYSRIDKFTIDSYLEVAIDKLQRLSFIRPLILDYIPEFYSGRALCIQRLVQKAVLFSMSLEEKLQRCEKLVTALKEEARICADSAEGNNRELIELYIPHIQHLAQQFDKCMQVEKHREGKRQSCSVEISSLLSPAVISLSRRRQFEEAEELAKLALLSSSIANGAEHRVTAKAENDLLLMFSMKRDFDTARSHGEEAFKIRKSLLGLNDKQTLFSIHYLALIYTQLGEINEAARIYREAAKALDFTAIEALGFTFDHLLSHKEVDGWLQRWRREKSKNGAKIKYDKLNLSPLHQAIQDNDFHIIKSFADYFKPFANACDNDGLTPIHYASIAGQVRIARFIIDLGGNAEVFDKFMGTPLHLAAMQGHDEIVEFWVRNKADVNARNKDGYTPLHCAAKCGHIQAAKRLVGNNADVNARNDENGAEVDAKHFEDKTPLHYAASLKNIQSAKVLVENGADINTQDESGWTPLHYAAANGIAEMVYLLLRKGANLNIEDDVGYRPQEIAETRGKWMVGIMCKYYLNYGELVEPPYPSS